jgi:hypothetical protein
MKPSPTLTTDSGCSPSIATEVENHTFDLEQSVALMYAAAIAMEATDGDLGPRRPDILPKHYASAMAELVDDIDAHLRIIRNLVYYGTETSPHADRGAE